MKKNSFIPLPNQYTYDTIQPDVLRLIEEMKIKEIISRHPYKITEPKDEKARWSTYVNTDKGRKKIARSSYSSLQQALIEFYEDDNIKKNTLETLYQDWLNKKSISTKSTETLRRHSQHWNRYYLNNPVVSIPLQKLTKEHIEDFFHLTIKKYKLTKKELNNMKLIFKGILEFAYDRNIIFINPWDKCKLNTGLCRHVPKKSNETQVYLPKDIEAIFLAMEATLKDYPDMTSIYAIQLIFQLGVRVGELVALKWSDIEGNYVHVQRMESKQSTMSMDGTFTTPRRVIVEHVKTNNDEGNRKLYLTEKARIILNTVREINQEYHFGEDDFIFCNAKGRINSRNIANRIEKLCHNANIMVKSSHDIRRTFASLLDANGVPLDEIRRALGHRDERTALGYLFNPYGNDKTEQLYESAL